MFTNEHDFDASVITLIDEGSSALREDVIVTLFDDQVTIEQYDAETEMRRTITLSLTQFTDLRTALNLPEGTYRRGGAPAG
ncbi:MAG: hypothetical protein AAFY59_07295 [Pseudomonadota bacterium]